MSGICLKTIRKVAGNGQGARETRSPAVGSTEQSGCARGYTLPCTGRGSPRGKRCDGTLNGVCDAVSRRGVCTAQWS